MSLVQPVLLAAAVAAVAAVAVVAVAAARYAESEPSSFPSPLHSAGSDPCSSDSAVAVVAFVVGK